ncbi:MAG: glycerophosphoryl diester phosphodiesterase [Acidimicrobiales bacterium]|jgi:glycerophosphoryl diester phosphodiesterase
MKRITLIFLAVIIIITSYLFLFEPKYSGLIKTDANEILLFAHRGFGNHAPDNSFVGAGMALENGLDGVDVDAQFSKDKQTFIFHDVTLERFTEGEGRVDAYALEQLQQYDMGLKYGDGTEFKDVYIESFETFVKEITPNALLMTELKIATPKDTGMEQDVINVIAKYDAFDQVYISTFNPVVLYRLKKIDPRVQTVFIFQNSGWDPARVAETKKEDQVSLPWYLQTEWTRRVIRKIAKPDALSINERVDTKTLERLQKSGWPIFLWPLNTKESIGWGIDMQPYGIVTDEPLLTKQLYEESKSN